MRQTVDKLKLISLAVTGLIFLYYSSVVFATTAMYDIASNAYIVKKIITLICLLSGLALMCSSLYKLVRFKRSGKPMSGKMIRTILVLLIAGILLILLPALLFSTGTICPDPSCGPDIGY